MTLAATGDTWGIPGPAFLGYFLGAIIVVAAIFAIHRRVLFAGRSDAGHDRLSPQQVAYLNGGHRLTVYTALGGLRAAGAIGSGPNRTLAQTGPIPAGSTPLDVAVYNAAGLHRRARDITSDQWVVAATAQLREALENAGLAVTAGQRRTARRWVLAAAGLVAVGILRLIAGVQNDKPVSLLAALLVVALIVTIVLYRSTRGVQTYAARRALRSVRTQHNHLQPKHSPAYATYGATGAAMGVALFGAASLYDIDPAFAAEAEIQRNAAATSSGGSSCGSGSSSCGGGGGGCGGGCGG